MRKSKNYVIIAINGLNHSKHINYFLSRNIPLLKIKREYKRLTLTVEDRYLKEIINYLDESLIDYRVIRYIGTTYIGSFLRNKIALLIGLVLSIGLLAIAFNTVFSVKISPLEKVDIALVEEVLAENNVKIPFFRTGFDTVKLKESISTIENVALTSVYIKGVTLYIDINEELDDSQIEKNNFSPIVADRDCIIEKVIVESGTALVEKGQAVKKGDVLIAPFYIFNKDENITYPCQAKGSVLARIFLEEKITFNENTIVTERNGNFEKQRILYLLGKPLSKNKESSFQNYQEEVNTIKIQSFPFEIVEITRYEVVENYKFIDFESVKDSIQAELLDKITQSIKKDVQILNKWCIIKNIMGTYMLQGIVEYMDSVGVIDESG